MSRTSDGTNPEDNSEGNRESGESLSSDEYKGEAGTLTQLFTSSVSVGADDPGSTVSTTISLSADGLADLATLYSNGVQLDYSVSGDTLTAKAGAFTVFTLQVNADGSWAFDLQDQLDHVNDGENDENWELVSSNGTSVGGIDFSSVLRATVTVTDADGDTISATSTTGAAEGSFVVKVQDDIPVVSVEAAGEEYSKVVGEVLEDGMSRTSDGTNPEDNSEGNRESGESLSSDEYKGDAGTLTQLFTSSVSVGADDPGSTVSTTISLSADGLADLATLYSNGVQLDYSVSGDTLTAKAGAFTVFTLQVNADGSWAFDLQDQLDHVNDGENDENWELVSSNGTSVGGIDFSSVLRATVTVTDADGDTISATSTTGAAEGSFVVKVQDDIPVVSVEAAGEEYSKVVGEVLEDGMSRTSDGTNPEDNSEGNREDGEPLSSDEYNSLLKNSPVRA